MALTFNDKMRGHIKGMYVTCYICQVGALSKAEDILEWNMGLVLATARILFLQNISRCEGRPNSCVLQNSLFCFNLTKFLQFDENCALFQNLCIAFLIIEHKCLSGL